MHSLSARWKKSKTSPVSRSTKDSSELPTKKENQVPKNSKPVNFVRVRIVVGHSIIHLGARNVPVAMRDAAGGWVGVKADWIEDSPECDSLMFVDWTQVNAVTYRVQQEEPKELK